MSHGSLVDLSELCGGMPAGALGVSWRAACNDNIPSHHCTVNRQTFGGHDRDAKVLCCYLGRRHSVIVAYRAVDPRAYITR